MMAVLGASALRILELQPSGVLAQIVCVETGSNPILEFFVSPKDEEGSSTTIVAVTDQFEVMSWTFDAALRQLSHPSIQSISTSGAGLISKIVAVPRRQWTTTSTEEVALLAVHDSGTLTFWTAAVSDSEPTWIHRSSVRTGRSRVLAAACSAERVSAVGA